MMQALPVDKTFSQVGRPDPLSGAGQIGCPSRSSGDTPAIGRRAVPSGGYSLVEVLIAVGMLALSLGSLVMTFQGISRETAFSSEHFTAMFLAQKVFEDINAMVKENPHSFTDLIAVGDGKAESVVDGVSPYFRLLENTKDFNRLLPAEDKPIATGSLYEHLKPFSVQVSTGFVPDDSGGAFTNLLRMTCTVFWTTREGSVKTYQVSQMVQGTGDEAFKEIPKLELPPARQAALDRGALELISRILGLPAGSDWSQVLSANAGGNRDLLLALGQIGFIAREALDQDDLIIAQIRKLEQERNALRSSQVLETRLPFCDLQKQIAGLYEQKGISYIGYFLTMKKPMEAALAILAADPPTALNEGGPVGKALFLTHRLSIREFLYLGDTGLKLMPFSLGCSEKLFLSLVAPPYLELIPRRKEVAFFRKVLDVQKLGILREKESGKAMPLLRGLQNNIRSFAQKYEGHFPHFEAFLKREREIASSLKGLQEQYQGVKWVFDELDNEYKALDELRRFFPEKL